MKIVIEIKTDDKDKIPAIMGEIGYKVATGIDMSNAIDYYFKIENAKPAIKNKI